MSSCWSSPIFASGKCSIQDSASKIFSLLLQRVIDRLDAISSFSSSSFKSTTGCFPVLFCLRLASRGSLACGGYGCDEFEFWEPGVDGFDWFEEDEYCCGLKLRRWVNFRSLLSRSAVFKMVEMKVLLYVEIIGGFNSIFSLHKRYGSFSTPSLPSLCHRITSPSHLPVFFPSPITSPSPVVGQENEETGATRVDGSSRIRVCLDGFEGRGNVITIASTNRPDILDPALVRPGRFDRKIFIPKPGLIGRVEILKVHALKKPMSEDVDYADVAAMTDGMVGAELITTDDLLQAAQIEERGMLDKKDRSLEIWKQVAINEAAMAVVAVNFHDLRNIDRQSLFDHITLQLAPQAADEIWHGADQLSTIWAETLITIVLLFIYVSSLAVTNSLCNGGPSCHKG
ncbi:probable inactive ATP-dependent zinc metalloprotease FTSHI 2, chloroplastic [Tanacetum coccineum]